MTRSNRLALAAAALILLAAVGWILGSPYYTLWQMREAARANDADRLSAFVDYPALRADLKSEISAQDLPETYPSGV